MAARFDRWKKMVDITIYVEGGGQSDNAAVRTFGSSAIFRENFHKLFSQKLSPAEFISSFNLSDL
jgi:hypothetical protein